jgi:hypothetical protein
MNRILAVAIAAAAIVTVTGAARADRVCQWTGTDWACGDGNLFPEHYAPPTAPNLVITPVPTVAPAGNYPLSAASISPSGSIPRPPR